MSFLDEIKAMMDIDISIQQQYDKIQIETFRKNLLKFDPKALEKLYNIYKNSLRVQIQTSKDLFTCHYDDSNEYQEVRDIIKGKFFEDGFIATEGRRGPYVTGFNITFRQNYNNLII